MITNAGTSHPQQSWPQWMWAQFFIHCRLVILTSSEQLLRGHLAPEVQGCLPSMPVLLPASAREAAEELQHGSLRRDSPHPAHRPKRAASPVLKDRAEGTQKVSGPLRFNFLPRGRFNYLCKAECFQRERQRPSARINWL